MIGDAADSALAIDGAVSRSDRKRSASNNANEEFYCRYYHGNNHRFGVDYYEFELYSDSGYFRYVNKTTNRGIDRNTRGKDDYILREIFLSPLVVQEFQKIVSNSGILDCSDKLWPEPSNDDGFIETTNDVNGLTKYFHVIQDLKALMSTLLKHKKSNFK